MKALVTGAAGLLGRALVARLRAEGVSVRAFVRPGRGADVDADEVCRGDLADVHSLAAAIDGSIDWVFHAGARVRTDGSWEDFESVNVQGTADVLRLSVDAGVRRIVHVSSLGVYAVLHDGAMITEDSAFDEDGAGRGYYARSKTAADRLALAQCERGAPITVVRPGLLFGPGKKPPLGRRVVAVGPFRIVVASRDYLLPLAYVDNVASALVLAARQQAAVGRAYTIVDAHVRQEDHLRLYRELTGQGWYRFYVPLAGVRMAARLVERGSALLGRKPPLTLHQVERTLRSATFDGRRAAAELGWKPHVDVRESMRRSLDGERPYRAGTDAPARSAA